MLKALSRFLPSKEYDIAIVQYERADFGVGAEEELHWAIVLLPSGSETKGRAFQVIDRHYQDERGVQWSLHDAAENLRQTKKCLGGVKVGKVGGDDYDYLCTVCDC